MHSKPQKVREPKSYSSLEAEVVLARWEEGEQMDTDEHGFKNIQNCFLRSKFHKPKSEELIRSKNDSPHK